jgi:hypothetical protein
LADLRKLLAIAIQGSDLSHDPNCETALDRIGALAFSDRLGGALWRVKYANDPGAFRPSIYILAKRMEPGRNPGKTVKKIAECVLREWLDPICRHCMGRGYTIIAESRRAKDACSKCDGTGQRRHSNQARAKVTGIPLKAYPKWERTFAHAHMLLQTADQQTWFDIATQLELITGISNSAGRYARELKKSLAISRERRIMDVHGRPAIRRTTPPPDQTTDVVSRPQEEQTQQHPIAEVAMFSGCAGNM